MLQFSWWTYLLIDLNNEIHQQRIEAVNLSALTQKQKEETIFNIQKDQKKKVYMISGEAAVFLIFLAFGALVTRNAFRKHIELTERQKNFLLAVTHELRTPIASIKLNMETLQKHRLNPEQKSGLILAAIKEADRLNHLAENVLTVATLDDHTFSYNKTEINLSELVNFLVSEFQKLNNKSIQIISEIENEILFLADRNAMTSVVQNLIENAIKYSPPPAIIKVELKQNDNEIIFSVADNAPVIHEKEKEKIFDKFYRSGSEEKRKAKGAGLGLFIVKNIVKAHSGKIKVIPNSPTGNIFRVTFASA